MIRAAIVEDDEAESYELRELLVRWAKERDVSIEIEQYTRPLQFLDRYSDRFDVVFMDIEMSGCDGLEASAKIRERDDTVVIVFVTHMAQLAVRGYEVSAVDFVVKPVRYERLARLMNRVARVLATKVEASLSVKSQSGVERVKVAEIAYVEVYRHKLLFHMVDGAVHESWGSLSHVEKDLPEGLFMRCNSCYLVNLRLVRGIRGDAALVGADSLHIARARKRDFVDAFVALAGE